MNYMYLQMISSSCGKGNKLICGHVGHTSILFMSSID